MRKKIEKSPQVVDVRQPGQDGGGGRNGNNIIPAERREPLEHLPDLQVDLLFAYLAEVRLSFSHDSVLQAES